MFLETTIRRTYTDEAHEELAAKLEEMEDWTDTQLLMAGTAAVLDKITRSNWNLTLTEEAIRLTLNRRAQ